MVILLQHLEQQKLQLTFDPWLYCYVFGMWQNILLIQLPILLWAELMGSYRKHLRQFATIYKCISLEEKSSCILIDDSSNIQLWFQMKVCRQVCRTVAKVY